jgi:integrase
VPAPLTYQSRGKTAYEFRFLRPDNGKRTRLRLGVVSKPTAEEVGRKIDLILECTEYNRELPPSLCDWLGGIGDDVYSLLVGAGLLLPREETSRAALQQFLDEYKATKHGGTGRSGGWKPTTEKSRQQTIDDLVLRFGAQRMLGHITAGDAEDWYQWLQKSEPKGRGLSPATAAKRLKDARQFFRYAVRKKLITDNPFEELKVPSQENPSRLVEVPRATIEKLLTSIQCSELRLVVALARYVGLRVPSETSHLRWRDVDFEHESLHVFAPKTEHHARAGHRTCPLLLELVPHFEAIRPATCEPERFVFQQRRGAAMNLRTALLREIKAAGLTPWPKLFQNLRANALTDLAETNPIHLVCRWLGNTIDVAMRHYLIIKRREYRGPSSGQPQNPEGAK